MEKSHFKQQLLFIKDVEQITGFSKVTLRRWWKKEYFPQPVKLNGSILAWHHDDIDQWIQKHTKRISSPLM